MIRSVGSVIRLSVPRHYKIMPQSNLFLKCLFPLRYALFLLYISCQFLFLIDIFPCCLLITRVTDSTAGTTKCAESRIFYQAQKEWKTGFFIFIFFKKKKKAHNLKHMPLVGLTNVAWVFFTWDPKDFEASVNARLAFFAYFPILPFQWKKKHVSVFLTPRCMKYYLPQKKRKKKDQATIQLPVYPQLLQESIWNL